MTGVWGVSGARAPLSAKSRILDLYLPTIAASLLMTAYVCRVGRRANALTSLIGRGFTSVLGALADLGWAALLAASILGIERAWIGAFGARQTASFGALMPHSVAEGAVWIVVAMTVGFCEEVVYRGYLRIQFTAFTRSSVVGNALQAALFGIAHGEQGVATVVRFSIYGILLGTGSRVRRSLVPAIICHVFIDLLSGFQGSA